MKKSLFVILLIALSVMFLSCSKTEKNNSNKSSGETQKIKNSENNSTENQNIEAEEEDEYTIYVDEEYYGTYLPVQSVYEIEKHKNFEKAKYGIPRECHTLLGLGRENRCYSDKRFHDGYAIPKKDFDKFKFEYRDNDLYLIDNNGYEYKRISNEVNIYKAINDYLMDEVCSCIKDLKNVVVYEDSINVDGKYNFSIGFDTNFINTRDALMILGLGLKTDGMSGGLYKFSEKAHSIGSFVSDEEFIHFPLLSYEPLIPLEEMSAKELRLYRNLQFARHGYKFKSPDLQETFSQFKWYEPKSSNSGIKLTKEEQAIVDKCLELEKQKEIHLPKNNIIDLSEEEKINYMVGVWYDRVPGKDNPYGFVFFPDGSFQYKDTVTDKEDKGDDKGFLSCKGTWKVKDNNIYVKVDEFKEKYIDNEGNEKIGKTTLSSAYIKIGELYNYETDDNKKPYKVDLYPILSCYAQKDNLRPFYYSKEDSDNITNLDFYNVEKSSDFGLCDRDKNENPISNYESAKNPITSKVITLPLGTDGSYGTSGTYVLLGDWPQSLKGNNVQIDESSTVNVNGWDCYKGSDGYYYVKETAKPVYNDRVEYPVYSNGTIIENGTEYYFKLEPIKWRVLYDDPKNGKLLLAENILFPHKFYTKFEEKIVDGCTVFTELNYQNSAVRAYLNGLDGSNYETEDFTNKGFINKAFTKEVAEIIRTSEVSNYGEITKDKIFLLDEEELKDNKYGFATSRDDDDVTRKKILLITPVHQGLG